MRQLRIGLIVLTSVAAACAVSLADYGAMARSNVQGTYKCGCTGGQGTCTVSAHSSGMICYKGDSDSCSGTCKLETTSSGITGPAAKGVAKELPELQPVQPKVQPNVVPKGTLKQQ
ncbi:MAG: hypothetical protein ACRECX_10505 [Methyloceanibacter sp.]|uniref:hypothetical protein n=1 Tax=Methyloceanibacter sp. TaxID=1965321 RepID=UPI003D6CE179